MLFCKNRTLHWRCSKLGFQKHIIDYNYCKKKRYQEQKDYYEFNELLSKKIMMRENKTRMVVGLEERSAKI